MSKFNRVGFALMLLGIAGLVSGPTAFAPEVLEFLSKAFCGVGFFWAVKD